MPSHLIRGISYFIFTIGFLLNPAFGQIDVFLDFESDLHDGSGGAANTIADWIDELNQATAAAGVSSFSAGERATIQSNIQSHLSTMYAPYNLSFTTTAPTGSHDTVYFGVEAGAGILGFAPLDIGNLFTDQITNVAPESFGFFIEGGESRADSNQRDFLGTGRHSRP